MRGVSTIVLLERHTRPVLSPSSLRGGELLELIQTVHTSADYEPVRLIMRSL